MTTIYCFIYSIADQHKKSAHNMPNVTKHEEEDVVRQELDPLKPNPFIVDVLKIAGMTVVPLAVVLGARMKFRDKFDYYEIYKVATLPHWAIMDPLLTVTLETICVAPIGYGVFLLTRDGLTTWGVPLALIACGTAVSCQAGFVITISWSKNPLIWLASSVVLLCSTTIAQQAVTVVQPNAKWTVVPFVLWAGYQTVETLVMFVKGKQNDATMRAKSTFVQWFLST